VKKSFLLMGILLTLACVCLAQSQPQSLADLAKQKKPAKKAVLVLSDEDIPPPSSPADDAHDGGGPPAATSSEPATKPDSGQPEATQSQDKDKKETGAPVSKDQRTNELKQKLASYQKEQDAWKKSAKRYEDLLANESDDFRRQMYQDALENDKHNTAVYQRKIDEVQSELSKQSSTSDGGNQP
jgi:valyl-tRNA synthetase